MPISAVSVGTDKKQKTFSGDTHLDTNHWSVLSSEHWHVFSFHSRFGLMKMNRRIFASEQPWLSEEPLMMSAKIVAQLWCEIYQIFTKIEPDILINDHVTRKIHWYTLRFVFFIVWVGMLREAVDNSLNSIQTPIKDSLSSNWWPSLTSAVWLGIMDSDRGVESCVDISNEIIAGHTAPHCHQPHVWPRGLFDVRGGADAGLGGGCLPTIIKYVLINKTWSNCLLSAPLLPISVCSFPRFRTSAFLLGLHQPPGRRLKAAAVKMRQNQTKKRLTGCLNS